NTPIESTAGGRPCVVMLSTNHGWLGLDPKTGEEIWSYKDAYTFRSVGSIAESDGILFASMGSGGGGKQATLLRINATPTPEVLASFNVKGGNAKGLPYVPCPIIQDGLMYWWDDGGTVTCFDLAKKEIVYQNRAGVGQFFSSPVLVDGKIYNASRDGVMFVIKAGREFEKLAENKLDSGVNATPAVALGRMFIRTETHLISLKNK
ncbi:MAG: PQQ-binding-like beta-propeller repeat protein, partial [Verrucomicrobiae bacterium]|nr:PQQ-binding-like beta-propeller repeat protein [Verrucomicrobiae bacterium]